MGLDMYVYQARKKTHDQEVPAIIESSPIESLFEDVDEFYYWRKHPDLHGWFEKLYRQKDGKKEFNVVFVNITLEDLEELEQAILDNNLPFTGGFFFGASTGKEKDGDLYFVDKAREALNQGYILYYMAWW